MYFAEATEIMFIIVTMVKSFKKYKKTIVILAT